jgi:hypothetical protein
MNKAGGNEKVHKTVELEFANPMQIQFAPFIADDGDLEFVPGLEPADQFNHFRMRFRLREHEAPKFGPRERAFPVKDDPIQIFRQRQLADLVGVERQVMPVFQFLEVEVEPVCRRFPGLVIPAVGQQHASDVQKQAGYSRRFLHRFGLLKEPFRFGFQAIISPPLTANKFEPLRGCRGPGKIHIHARQKTSKRTCCQMTKTIDGY